MWRNTLYVQPATRCEYDLELFRKVVKVSPLGWYFLRVWVVAGCHWCTCGSIFFLRSGPTRTRVVYGTRSVKDPAQLA